MAGKLLAGIQSVKKYLKKRGLMHALCILLKVIIKKTYIRSFDYVISQEPERLEPYTIPGVVKNKYSVVEITSVNRTVFMDMVPEQYLSMMYQRLQKGDRCWGAMDQGKLIGYLWISSRNQIDRDTQIKIEVLPGEGYLYDAFVKGSYRGKGVLMVLLNVSFSDEQIKKAKKIFAVINSRNLSSLRTCVRYGFQLTGQIKILRILHIFKKEKWESFDYQDKYNRKVVKKMYRHKKTIRKGKS